MNEYIWELLSERHFCKWVIWAFVSELMIESKRNQRMHVTVTINFEFWITENVHYYFLKLGYSSYPK